MQFECNSDDEIRLWINFDFVLVCRRPVRWERKANRHNSDHFGRQIGIKSVWERQPEREEIKSRERKMNQQKIRDLMRSKNEKKMHAGRTESGRRAILRYLPSELVDFRASVWAANAFVRSISNSWNCFDCSDETSTDRSVLQEEECWRLTECFMASEVRNRSSIGSPGMNQLAFHKDTPPSGGSFEPKMCYISGLWIEQNAINTYLFSFFTSS